MHAIKMFPNQNRVNIKEFVGQYEISIAFDDSCGTQSDLLRSDICVFHIGRNINLNPLIFNGNDLVIGTIENLIKAYQWCKEN